MTVKFTNNASTTIGTGINASATSLTVASASSFPSLSGADDYCYLTLQGATNTTREVVKATALSSNTFTIVRAQDNTSAASWLAGDIVELRMTAALLTDVIDAATVEGVKTNYQYTPTAGQTVFSGADNASATMIINQAALVSVYMNGVRLVQGTDYSVSSANNTVTLGIGATTADIIDIEVYGNFVGQSGAAVGITGGSITGTAITATSLGATGTATLNTLVSNNATISGGSLDGVTIGGTTRGAISGNAISGTSFASTGNMTFGDNDKAIFGAGSDLQIYHHPTDGSFIVDNGTGNLQLDATDFRVRNTAGTEAMIHANADGAVKLFYNGTATPKLETTASGISVTGTVTADGTASSSVPKYTFAGDVNTGLAYIGADAVGLLAAGSRKFYVNATTGYFQNLSGGVNFGSGIDVTGTVTADGLTVDGAADINGDLEVGSAGAGTKAIVIAGSGSSTSVMDLKMFGGGTGNPTSILRHSSATKDFSILTGNSGAELTRLLVTEGGDVGIGTSSVTNPNSYGRVLNVAGYAPAIVLSEDTGRDYTIGVNGNKFSIFDETDAVLTIDDSGNVLVGASLASAKLTVGTFGDTARAAQFHGGSILIDGGAASEILIGDGNVAYMSIQTTDNATAMKIRNYSGNADLVTIERASGNVGIGCTPGYTFEVRTNDTSVTPQQVIRQIGSGDAAIGFQIPSAANWYAGVDNSASDSFVIGRGLAVGTDVAMTLGASAATFSGNITATAANINGQLNVTGTTNSNNIYAQQLSTQFDTSSFMRFHPTSVTDSGGFTNIFFGTSTLNNYGVAVGGKRAGTEGEPTFEIRMLNDSTVGTQVLNIANSGDLTGTANTTGLAANFENTNTSGYGMRVTTYSNGAEYGLAVDSYGGGYSRDFTVGVDGNVNVLTGNLVIGTAGKGIDFSATAGSGTSELLDDYEAGTWTPSLQGGTTAGTTTYGGNPTGWYRKIGDQVTVFCQLYNTGFTGTGMAEIHGLPFTANNESVGEAQMNQHSSSFSSSGGGLCGVSSIIQANAFIHMRGTYNDSTVGPYYVQMQNFTYLRITITYKTS